jgi:hypothetical protein
LSGQPDDSGVIRSTNYKFRGKVRLLTRGNLDRRTAAVQRFDAVSAAIAADLGGEEHLSTIAKHLIEAFAGVALHVGDLNARLIIGEDVDAGEHSQAVSTMVRVAQRIGVNRVARDVTPSLQDYLSQHYAGDAEPEAAPEPDGAE